MHITFLVAALSILVACSTALTPEGAQVRQISAQTSNDCKFLGPITGAESWGASIAMDVDSAFNKVRNQVAQRGGNAFVVSASSTSIETTAVHGDAYRC